MTLSIRYEPAMGASQFGDWLGDSEMAARIRAFDWSATPLGPLIGWPRSLRAAVAICPHSQFQMAIYWGPELTCIYNDAERDVLGKLHPRALGMSAGELLRDSWKVVGPQLEAVMDRGEATWAEDQPLAFDRRGMLETGRRSGASPRQVTPSADGSNAICTMARSSGLRQSGSSSD